MAAEEYRTSGNMDVHQKVHDARLQVAGNAIDDHLGANVDLAQVRYLPLIVLFQRRLDGRKRVLALGERPSAVAANRLIDLAVMVDAAAEVVHDALDILDALVIGAGALDLTDVHIDQFVVFAPALAEHNFDVVLLALVHNHLAPRPRRVCGIVDSHTVVHGFKPLEHVLECQNGTLQALVSGDFIAGVKEAVVKLSANELPAILADIEHATVDTEPSEITRN
ncbi:hypothetical protein FBU31_003620 [Coemansia sp. 'formosensis']|nr:hypothetical protein FBU31_003620 [Coemansia sp. 'formosensis']